MIVVVQGRKIGGNIEFTRINHIFNDRLKYSVAVKSVSLQVNDISLSHLDNGELLVLKSNLIETSAVNLMNSIISFPFNKNCNWQFFKPCSVSYYDIIVRDLNYCQFAIERFTTGLKIDFERIFIELEFVQNDRF